MSIAVYLESFKGNMVKASKEAISVAQMLAEKRGVPVFGIALDEKLDNVVTEAGKLGVSTLKSSEVSLYHPALFSRFIVNAAKDADVIVLPATVWGQEIAPIITMRLDATPVTDIIGVIDGNTFKRSIHGNKIHSTVKAEGKLVITIRPGVFDVPQEGDGTANVEGISAEMVDSDNLMKLAEILASSSGKIELTEADIIVSGGRGMGGPENYKIIEELADVLGAAVGASRAAVDAGWRPHSDQVGQTGKFVSPKLYIACGISGAIQHLAGMSTSDVIVCINKDEEAPIFKVSDFGIVGDLFDVVPKLTEAIKKVKGMA